jgi:hypothetical protein
VKRYESVLVVAHRSALHDLFIADEERRALSAGRDRATCLHEELDSFLHSRKSRCEVPVPRRVVRHTADADV